MPKEMFHFQMVHTHHTRAILDVLWPLKRQEQTLLNWVDRLIRCCFLQCKKKEKSAVSEECVLDNLGLCMHPQSNLSLILTACHCICYRPQTVSKKGGAVIVGLPQERLHSDFNGT